MGDKKVVSPAEAGDVLGDKKGGASDRLTVCHFINYDDIEQEMSP